MTAVKSVSVYVVGVYETVLLTFSVVYACLINNYSILHYNLQRRPYVT